jgi:hypothetical protein
MILLYSLSFPATEIRKMKQTIRHVLHVTNDPKSVKGPCHAPDIAIELLGFAVRADPQILAHRIDETFVVGNQDHYHADEKFPETGSVSGGLEGTLRNDGALSPPPFQSCRAFIRASKP